ncbi:Uncharacterised protein [Providencia rustigianii]|uniref:Uncharacterized protein n=2 Tax=Enterobacterales TaxID=91347 RepID=A0A7L8KC89_ECOLX|nr:hypothetical protein [Escherichia coli]UCK65643.1 hypothetical protein [Providencia rettgeri]SPY66632.1 Uncharacterised protein [Providencia stuartii]SUC33758.1 Uncharacterised protein [Providencia rustigianii]
MDAFGVFGIIPINGHTYVPRRAQGRRKVTENVPPLTPSVFKEKIVTSFLLIASLPMVFMISQL